MPIESNNPEIAMKKDLKQIAMSLSADEIAQLLDLRKRVGSRITRLQEKRAKLIASIGELDNQLKKALVDAGDDGVVRKRGRPAKIKVDESEVLETQAVKRGRKSGKPKRLVRKKAQGTVKVAGRRGRPAKARIGEGEVPDIPSVKRGRKPGTGRRGRKPA
jgi:hypothetical protein